MKQYNISKKLSIFLLMLVFSPLLPKKTKEKNKTEHDTAKIKNYHVIDKDSYDDYNDNEEDNSLELSNRKESDELEEMEHDMKYGRGFGGGVSTFGKGEDQKINDVFNIGGMIDPNKEGIIHHDKKKNGKICKDCGVEIDIHGKFRSDSLYSVNNQFLNDKTDLDKTIVPWKGTYDLGIKAAYPSKNDSSSSDIELGIQLRARITGGSPESVGMTTTTSLKDGDVNFGAHNHTIGIPILYVRGLDFTMNLNSICCSMPSQPKQWFKVGMFPFELGRGISLGAAFKTSPGIILSYAPGDVIQEFAPGFLLYGDLNDKKTLNYKAYFGIIKNNSGSSSDVMSKVGENFYGRSYFPYRGFGILNTISALQLVWRHDINEKDKSLVAPYCLYYNEGAGRLVLPDDSKSELITLGLEYTFDNPEWNVQFEIAKNFGTQYVYGIDTNIIQLEQRTYPLVSRYDGVDIATPFASTSLYVNSKVNFTGYEDDLVKINNGSIGTDIINNKATFLGNSSERQKAINSFTKNSSSNGATKTIYDENNKLTYNIKNADDRYRDPYQNALTGWMFVFDISKNRTIYGDPFQFNFAFGFASGDDHPNKFFKKDANKRSYNGMITLNEVYSGGPKVKSGTQLTGGLGAKRYSSYPEALIDENGQITKTLEYPSPINGFTNLIYAGTSFSCIKQTNNYNWQINPNILFYAQPSGRTIYHKNIKNILEKDTLDPFLGTEINCFIEANSRVYDGLKFFAVLCLFLPGAYYKDLAHIPLNAEEERYFNDLANNTVTTFLPTRSTNTSYFINLGLEFKF